MKKIAIFQTDLDIGGIQKSLINLLNNLDYTKYEIDLYIFKENNYLTDELNKKVNCIYLKPMPYITRGIYFSILNKLYTTKINKSYDIAIDFNSYSMDTSLNTINCNAKKKIIWVHNDIDIKLKEEKKYKFLYHFFKSKYQHYDCFVGVSKGAIESFKKYHNYKDKEYMVIPNLIDTNKIIELSNEKQDLTVDNNLLNICSVGRITHQKAFDILVNDIKKLVKYRQDFHLYIIGDGNEFKKIQKLINENKLNNYISLIGNAKNPYALMNQMDAFILESRYEGQGMVFLEAKCLGLDIIMPKKLEKYVEGINGTNNVLESLKKLTKNKNKKIDNLVDYNKEIITKINDLFDN